MGSVARGQRGVMSENDAGDHGIAQLAWAALLPPLCRQFCRALRSIMIERDDSVVQFLKQVCQSSKERRSPLTGGHDLQSEVHLKDSD